MSDAHSLKRPLLYLLVASVILAAVLGIALVLRNEWGELEIRVILTTITIAVASVCGLACDLSRTAKGPNIFPISGLILTGVAAVLILFGIWSDPGSEEYWKSTVCACVFAVALAHVCLLSIARLPRRFGWVLPVAYQVIFGLAAIISVMFVWQIDNQRMFQLIAAVSILAAAMTLMIPILHRIGKTDPTTAPPLTLFDEKNVAAINGEILQLRKKILELEKLRDEVSRGG